MKLIKVSSLSTLGLLLAIPTARAQQQQQQPQQQSQQSADSTSNAVAPLPPLPPDQAGGNGGAVPAARGLFVGADQEGQGAVPTQPDTHVLSSPESMGLGSPAGLYQLFDPLVRVSESIASGIVPNQLDSVTSVGGAVSYDQQWNKYRLTALYTGAQTFYAPASYPNTAYQEATLSQQIRWNRWTVRLRDDLVLAPGNNFSGLYTGSTGLAGTTAPIPGTAPVLTSNETIQTGLARSLTDSTIGEVDLSLSPRASLTATGTYGLIDFLVPGYVNSYRAGVGAGYNYSLDAKNSISVFYNYSVIGFRSQSDLLITQSVQAAYGRRITGRLAFQASAGPELLQLENFGPSSGQHWSWVLSTSLNYQLTPTTGVQATYFHAVTAGSGVFLGALSDTVTGGVSHQFARTWSGSVNGGYARNNNLVPVSAASNLYNTWFAGASLTHGLTRQVIFHLSYGLQDQTSAPGQCTVASCGLPAGAYQVGTVGIDWHPFGDRFNRQAY